MGGKHHNKRTKNNNKYEKHSTVTKNVIFPITSTLFILKGWYVIKGESFITSEGVVGDVGVVGTRDKHECPEHDNGPCAVCIFLLNVASDKETPNHQQEGAS